MTDIRDLGRAARAAAGLLMLASTAAPAWAWDSTQRVSVSSRGVQGKGGLNGSDFSSISAHGRFVAFDSDAANLVPHDTNGTSDCNPVCGFDVFVRDRETGTTERVSVGPHSRQGNSDSGYPAVSANGRFVAFQSSATDLVKAHTSGFGDVYVRDRLRGTTELVSVGPDGRGASGTNPSISATGRFVAFESGADSLVKGDTNGNTDVFVRDRLKGTTERVSVESDGTQAETYCEYPSISATGRFVAFATTEGPDARSGGARPTATPAGHILATYGVFLRDRETGKTEEVDLGPGDVPGWTSAVDGSFSVAVSADGLFVAFEDDATGLVPGKDGGVFLRDRTAGRTKWVADGYGPSISAGGRFVAFISFATNLVPGDTNGLSDVFVRDRRTGATERVSISSAGKQAKGGLNNSRQASISADGLFAAFDSDATNLVAGDTNGTSDVFVRRR